MGRAGLTASRGWPAPAKINLFLHVIGRRPDGYHLLQTVFQFLDCCDTIDFEPSPDGAITRVSDLPGVAAEDDLVVRAARLLQRSACVQGGVRIRVRKQLPMGGGLGGGSSDAATTLVALNRLWGIGLTSAQLAGLGVQLGADVPVFVQGQAAWAEGVGERLEPVELPEPWYLVLNPGCSISTAEIFAAPDLTRDSPPTKMADFLAGRVRNDCEPVVRARYPAVAAALSWLGRYAAPRLTGTGACVYASFPEEAAAREVLAAVPQAWSGFVARGLNYSPLLARAAQGA